MTIVEKMARAICRANLSGGCTEDCDGFDRPYCSALKLHGEDALAALKAIREPSEGMITAMNGIDIGPGYDCMYASLGDCRSLFAAAIDHAIQEHEG